MGKSIELGDYFLYHGKLAQKVFQNSGLPTHGFNIVKKEDWDKCPHCGEPLPTQLEMVQDSPLFLEGFEPLKQESRLAHLKQEGEL